MATFAFIAVIAFLVGCAVGAVGAAIEQRPTLDEYETLAQRWRERRNEERERVEMLIHHYQQAAAICRALTSMDQDAEQQREDSYERPWVQDRVQRTRGGLSGRVNGVGD